MNIATLLIDGLQVMLMGMGFVFLFLGLLVLAVSCVSHLLANAPLAEPAPADSASTAPPPDLLDDPELVSVITSAVYNYRKQIEDSGKKQP
ncbi:MAG: OadG family transporter subunit [Pseudomonadota bacterium]